VLYIYIYIYIYILRNNNAAEVLLFCRRLECSIICYIISARLWLDTARFGERPSDTNRQHPHPHPHSSSTVTVSMMGASQVELCLQ